uniref:Uncharacterized protein n=2 Tax=Cajanus cajan TaxID=3821 RepID=A0A151TIU3_CAJCA|nr:hypothetical protein KK1_013265 [Cajanus cajan]
MGNSHGGVRLLGNRDGPYHVQLAKSTTINSKGEIKWEDDGKMIQTSEISYAIDGLTCTLSMKKTTETNSDETLEIAVKDILHQSLHDGKQIQYSQIFFDKVTKRAGVDLTLKCTCSQTYPVSTLKTHSLCCPISKRTDTNSSTSVTRTKLCTYWYGTKKGILVREWKMRPGNLNIYMMTWAHYCVATNSNNGFSMVAKMRMPDNGYWDFKVNGPTLHPSLGLFFMIEQVNRTGTWKYTACPHCVIAQTERDHSSTSENEHNDDGVHRLPLQRLKYTY